MKKFVALNLRHQIFIGLGPGPVVIWVNSNQRGSEFESQCLIIDGLFYRFLFGVWKERKFMKLRPGWPFLPYCRCKRFITLARTLKKTFYNVGPNTKKVSTVAPQHTPNSQPANTSYWAKIKALIWVSMAHGGGGCGCCGAGCDWLQHSGHCVHKTFVRSWVWLYLSPRGGRY